MQYTNQTAFSESVKWLRKQNCKSNDLNGTCYYRGPNNTKCAIGCLIPDGMDDEILFKFNGLGVGTLLRQSKKFKTLFSCVSYDLLRRLQDIHDGEKVEFWEEKWKEFAESYNLEMP